MAQEQVGGGSPLRGEGQLPGAFKTSKGAGRGAPPAQRVSPMVYTVPGDYVFGAFPDSRAMTVKMWSGGGGGGAGSGGNGGTGGTAGGFQSYEFGAGVLPPNGVLRLHVGAGGTPGSAGASTTMKIDKFEGFQLTYGPAGGRQGGGSPPPPPPPPPPLPLGLTLVDDENGDAGEAGTGATGGGGGGQNVTPGGGAGGAGGTTGVAGSPGTPAGGAGGGGGNGAAGGAGAAGRIEIIW